MASIRVIFLPMQSGVVIDGKDSSRMSNRESRPTGFEAAFGLLMLASWLLAGCQPASATSPLNPSAPKVTPEVTVVRSVVTTGPSPTPVVCTPLPDGMTIQVKPESETSVLVELAGLQPGERLVFIYTTEIPGQHLREYVSPATATVGLDGHYAERESDMVPIPGSANQWQVKVIHARGVACAEVTLPSP